MAARSFPEEANDGISLPFYDVEAKPNAESLQAIQEAEDFFMSGWAARFGEAEEVFDELGV